MPHFLSIGECMVELAPQAGGLYSVGFAGDTFNTAWYMRKAAHQSVKVAYLTAVGDDALSGKMVDFIRGSGIEPQVSVIPGRTVGLYMISLVDGERSFSYWRSVSAARDLAKHLDGLVNLGKDDMAYFSGITIAILPPEDRKPFLDALSKARESGVTIAFDPNLRPRLWPDSETMCRSIMEAAAVADIVLPSHEDEADHFGDADKDATARRYQDAGAMTVIVKDGAGDVLVATSNEHFLFPTQKVESPVDTTAAGDSFNAGFLAAVMEGKGLKQAVENACALSAKVIMGKGALVEF